MHEEVPGRPHLLYLLPGFLPHKQGEGAGAGKRGFHVGVLSPKLYVEQMQSPAFTLISPLMLMEKKSTVRDALLEIAFVGLHCPVFRPVKQSVHLLESRIF